MVMMSILFMSAFYKHILDLVKTSVPNRTSSKTHCNTNFNIVILFSILSHKYVQWLAWVTQSRIWSTTTIPLAQFQSCLVPTSVSRWDWQCNVCVHYLVLVLEPHRPIFYLHEWDYEAQFREVCLPVTGRSNRGWLKFAWQAAPQMFMICLSPIIS